MRSVQLHLKTHSQETSISGWNLIYFHLLAFSMLFNKEKVLAKLLNTAKLTSMLNVFRLFLLSLQLLFPTPPISHKLCLVRYLEIPCLSRWGLFLGLPVTYLIASIWLWALSPALPSLASPWPPSSAQSCSRLWNYFPCTFPSQRPPQEA